MATKKELMRCWLECKDKENVIFLFDDEGDPIAWCSRCLHVDVWSLRTFEGEISHVIETKESFKEQHANCKPRQSEAKLEVKQGDEEMGRCERSKMIEGWKRKTGLDYLLFYDTMDGALSSICNVCKEKTEDYTLRDTKSITPQLADEMYSLKARIVSRHMGCGDKQELQEPKPEQASIQAFERRIHEIAKQVADTVIRKHKDYGRSGLQAPLLAPHITALDALLVRQSDKYSRIQNLLKKGTPEVKESIMDTALDILGYDMLIAVEVERLVSEASSIDR